MSDTIKQTFYELRLISPIHTTEEYYVVREILPTNDYTLVAQALRTVMRGTLSQCQAWLDERPGSAISIASQEQAP